jgi:toxin ParE1/3/4
MPTSEVRFHRLAAREHRAAKNWYRERSAEAAERFRIAVDKAVSRIVSDADSLPTLTGVYHYVRVNRFPYVLIFRQTAPSVVTVIAVAHTSRRPGYWRGRK